ncbi:TIGR03085 family metal-binding protein [Corynebacterium frankenforstense]|uniref:TIGR03085 family metal-binding protein n=1 Tax=Corynebacterium frankenforstense TaxID=1230998 RepID=UPI0026F24C57|nr:TIGR03085 family metal-binding protein [Corynebacterium frankenforstense]
MTFAMAERRRLAELLLELGPDAPTLCEGWTTRDLAAHLWVREHRPDAAAGMFLPPASGHLRNVTADVLGGDYAQTVRDWAAGAPRWNPMHWLDRAVNTAENFVHHEDVRRADGTSRPRDFSRVVDDELWAAVGRMGTMLLRSSGKPVILTAPGRTPVVAARGRGVAEQGDDVVRVTGEPGELLLWAFGRDAVDVEIGGDEAAVNRSSL